VHHRHEARARRYALPNHLVDAVKPSPAREGAHDPASWFPLVAVTPPGDHRHTVRPMPSRPAVVVRHSPAREGAHDPESWFPLAELEALLTADELVPEQPPKPSPIAITPVVADPTPAPAHVPEPARTRREIQRARRTRRLRTRLRLVAVGAGLGIGLFVARVHLSDPAPSQTASEADPAGAGPESSGAGVLTGGGAAVDAQPIEPVGFSAVLASQLLPPPPPPPPPPLPNEAIWDRMAQCETGGNWAHYGPTWSGGLGIYRGTWHEAGGGEFAALPRDATREQQIIVAERIRERYGWTAWGCASTIGMG